MSVDVAEPVGGPQHLRTRGRWGVRSVAALVIFIIATLLTPVALVGHWGHRTVIDSQRYIDTVGPLVDQPEVQAAITEVITDAVVANVDIAGGVEDLLDRLFPDSTVNSLIAAPITAGIDGLIGNLVERFVQSEAFRTAWISLNKAAQRSLVVLLEGGQDGPVRVDGDQVVLDISSALVTAQQFLVDRGIPLVGNLPIPETDRQIVLMDAPALAQARFIYALTSPILQWFPLIVAILFGAAIALARRRPRTIAATGIALVGSAALLAGFLSSAQEDFIDQLQSTVFGPAAHVFWETLLAYLILGVKAVLVLGVVVIVAGWFSGRTGSALWSRGHVVAGLADIGWRVPGGAQPRRWLAAHVRLVRWLIFVLVTGLLLATQTAQPSTVLWCAALAAGLVTALQILTTPPAEPAPTMQEPAPTAVAPPPTP